MLEENKKPYVEVNVGNKKKRFAPEEISSMVLAKMKVWQLIPYFFLNYN